MSSIVIGYLFAVFLIALAYSGVYLSTSTKGLYIPTDNECRNPTLWKYKLLVSQTCPLAKLNNNFITYRNKENYDEDRDLVVLCVGKIYSQGQEPSEVLRINMEAVVNEMDKKTQKVVQKHFIEFDHNSYGYYINNSLSSIVEIARIPMQPNRFYKLEVLQLAGFNCEPGDDSCSDLYLNGALFINAMMWPSTLNQDISLVRYQKVVFSSSLFFTIIFLFKLSTQEIRRLRSARTWLTLAFTVAVLSYTCPEPWIKAYFPRLRELVTYRQAYIATDFLSACIADISLIHLPRFYNQIAWILVIIINAAMVSSKLLAGKESLGDTRTADTSIDPVAAFAINEINYQAWADRKVWILNIICMMFYFMKFRANQRWQSMSPALMVLAIWICYAGRGKLPFKQYETIVTKIHLDLAYIPCAVFLYQYLSLGTQGAN